MNAYDQFLMAKRPRVTECGLSSMTWRRTYSPIQAECVRFPVARGIWRAVPRHRTRERHSANWSGRNMRARPPTVH